jgi:hypothetical protein
MPTFEVEAMVRGYHVYQDIWDAIVHEELACARELDILRDPFAVAVVKSRQTVGHVPKKISSVCSLFLQHGGSITCKVTGRRRRSEDLTQGGLEIPCTLTFVGGLKDVTKVEKLVTKFLVPKKGPEEMKGTPAEKNHLSGHVNEDEPSRKKRRPDDNHLDVETESILDGEKS